MFELYQFNPLDPKGPFVHWPPAQKPSDDGLPDRIGCLVTILSWLLVALLIGIIMAITSCTPQRVVIEYRDSLRTEVRTETVYVPDTVTAYLPDQSVSALTPDTTSRLETDYAVSEATILHGLLRHTLANKPTPLRVPVEYKVITRDSIVYRGRQTTVPAPATTETPASRYTWWDNLRFRLLYAILAAIAVYALVHWRTTWLRLLKHII